MQMNGTQNSDYCYCSFLNSRGEICASVEGNIPWETWTEPTSAKPAVTTHTVGRQTCQSAVVPFSLPL